MPPKSNKKGAGTEKGSGHSSAVTSLTPSDNESQSQFQLPIPAPAFSDASTTDLTISTSSPPATTPPHTSKRPPTPTPTTLESIIPIISTPAPPPKSPFRARSGSKESLNKEKPPTAPIPTSTNSSPPTTTPTGSKGKLTKEHRLSVPTAPEKTLGEFVFAPLGDGELTPKPLKFGNGADKEDLTPRVGAEGAGKNIFSNFFTGVTAGRPGDDFAPQEPLRVFMASGGKDEGGKKDGEEKKENALPKDSSASHPGRNSRFIEPTYPRTTVVHGTPQIAHATASDTIRPRTPADERQRLYEEDHRIQSAAVEEGAGGGDSDEDGNDNAGGDGSRRISSDRFEIGQAFKPIYPDQPSAETEPPIFNPIQPEGLEPRTPSPERRRHDKEKEGPEEEERKRKTKTLHDALFEELFPEATERRYLGPDGRVAESISNAPILGNMSPPREKRKAKRERLAMEFEEEKQDARDRGLDPDTLLAKPTNVSNLVAYPIETKAQEKFRDYANEDDNTDKEWVKLALAALDAADSAQLDLVGRNLGLEDAYDKQQKAMAPVLEALMSEKAVHDEEIENLEAKIKSLRKGGAKGRRSSDELREEEVYEVDVSRMDNVRLLNRIGVLEKQIANEVKQAKEDLETAIVLREEIIKQLEDKVQQLNIKHNDMISIEECRALNDKETNDLKYQLDVANRMSSKLNSKLRETSSSQQSKKEEEGFWEAEELQEQLAKAQREHMAAKNKFVKEKNGLNRKILELGEDLGRMAKVLEDIEDAKSEESQRSDSVATGNGNPAHDSINFVILRVENALRTMVYERTLYGFRDGDTNVARTAAAEASTLADHLKDEALQGRAYFWYGVALYYAGESNLASDILAKAQDFTHWLHPLREKKWLAKWVDAANSKEVCRRKEDYWSPALYEHLTREQKKKAKKGKGKDSDK